MSSFPDYMQKDNTKFIWNGIGNELFACVVSPTRSHVTKFLSVGCICIRNVGLFWSRSALPFHSLSLEKQKLLDAFLCIHSHVTVLCQCLFSFKRRDHLPPVTFQVSGIYCQYSIEHGDYFERTKISQKPAPVPVNDVLLKLNSLAC